MIHCLRTESNRTTEALSPKTNLISSSITKLLYSRKISGSRQNYSTPGKSVALDKTTVLSSSTVQLSGVAHSQKY